VNEHAYYSPPPPPMTLVQVQQHQQRKQQSLLEEQVQLEQRQRMRQQRELQLELAKHRNAILEQQQQQNQLAQVRQKEQEQQQQQQESERKAAEKLAAEGLERKDLSAAVQPELATQHDTTADETRTRPQFVATRHRSMFGYRGPEQKMEQGNELKEKNRKEEEDNEEEQVSTKPSRIPFMITAESRVRLALLDYTPKQIDAMTPQQAQAILSPLRQQEREQSEPRVDDQAMMTKKEEEEEQHALDMSRIVVDADNNYAAHAVDVMAAPRALASPQKHGHGHVSSSSSSSSSSRRPSGSSSSSSSPASIS